MSAPPHRAALYLDFDNVFAGLALRDEAAAWHFAAEPGRWLAWLAEGGDGGGQRRILVRRCYLNPAGWTEPVPGGALAQWLGQPRIFYGRFRPDFVRAGFHVIDCPRLARLKNGADILMALDVADALAHPTRFEEFILLSGDSDFTPLLHRLREHDRRTLLVAQDASTQALRAAADVVLGFDDFAAVAAGPEPEAPGPAEPPPAATRDALQAAARQILEAQQGRIRLSALGQALRQHFGNAVADNAYGGTGSLQKLLAGMPGVHLRTAEGADWASLGEEPTASAPAAATDPFAEARAIVAEAGGSLSTAALGNLFQQRLGFGLRNSAYAGAGSLDDFVDRAGLRFGAEGNDRNMVMLAPDGAAAAATGPEVDPGGAFEPPIDAGAEPFPAARETMAASPPTPADAPGLVDGAEAQTDAAGDDPTMADATDLADAPHDPIAELLLGALGPGLDLSGLTRGTLAAILAALGRRLPLAGPPAPALADTVLEEAAETAPTPPPHAVLRLIRLLQLGRFDWSADPGPEAWRRLAQALEAEILRQAAISRRRLGPAEQALLKAWLHGPDPATDMPPDLASPGPPSPDPAPPGLAPPEQADALEAPAIRP